jgi:hypothetical protein
MSILAFLVKFFNFPQNLGLFMDNLDYNLEGALWIIWVKIGSSLIFYFVAINDDLTSTKNVCRAQVPQRVIMHKIINMPGRN